MSCSANPGASVGVSDAINGIQASASALCAYGSVPSGVLTLQWLAPVFSRASRLWVVIGRPLGTNRGEGKMGVARVVLIRPSPATMNRGWSWGLECGPE